MSAVLGALSLAFGMAWNILWALILGFALSAAVQAVVSKSEMTRLLPDDSPRSLGISCGLVLLLLCGGRSRALHLPQGRRLHGGHHLRVRLHQPRD